MWARGGKNNVAKSSFNCDTRLNGNRQNQIVDSTCTKVRRWDYIGRLHAGENLCEMKWMSTLKIQVNLQVPLLSPLSSRAGQPSVLYSEMWKMISSVFRVWERERQIEMDCHKFYSLSTCYWFQMALSAGLWERERWQ